MTHFLYVQGGGVSLSGIPAIVTSCIVLLFNRQRLTNDSFWAGDTDVQSRKRKKMFNKAADIEQEYRETRQKINRQLRSAQTRLEAKKAELRRASYRQLKAKAGYL